MYFVTLLTGTGEVVGVALDLVNLFLGEYTCLVNVQNVLCFDHGVSNYWVSSRWALITSAHSLQGIFSRPKSPH